MLWNYIVDYWLCSSGEYYTLGVRKEICSHGCNIPLTGWMGIGSGSFSFRADVGSFYWGGVTLSQACYQGCIVLVILFQVLVTVRFVYDIASSVVTFSS